MAFAIASIYLITNTVNGKQYVGYTTNVKQRWYKHKNAKTKSHIGNAIRKYQWESFTFEVIYQSKEIEHALNVMEDYFIDLYDTYKNGYNTSRGGNQGAIGYKHSEKRKQKISKVLKEKHWMKRDGFSINDYPQFKYVSEEARQRMRDLHKG